MTNTTKAQPSITSMGSSWRSVASRWFGHGTSVVSMSANIAFDPIRSFWPNTKLSIYFCRWQGYIQQRVRAFTVFAFPVVSHSCNSNRESNIKYFVRKFIFEYYSPLFDWQQPFLHKCTQLICPFSAVVSRSISVAWVVKSLFATFCSLWLVSREGTKYIQNCKQSLSCESRFILLFVVSWVLHSSDSRPKAILDAHLLRGDDFVFPIILPLSYQCTRAVPGCDRDPPGLTVVESACQQNFQPQTLSGLLVEVYASHSERWLPIEHSWLYCNAWNRAICSGRRGGADLKLCSFEHARTAGYGTICM